ncbi:hypothetical protein PAHAL_5G140000 [Panicum hallii]|uniref:Uncharacterized protein n=1 Tax=Panicum hallii TaxID=206008 RepID=A0A2S3HR84_9POAL|nr:uncharacterized protein LOC112893200 isoform X2 [Panicum hallii]PAN28252.1 hypothetical protein PAHAL_5G140000 [Panicum hallii]
MASRKAAVASLPSLLLIGALVVVMASPGAVAEEGAASAQFPSPDSATPSPTPEPSPKNSRAVRAGSPAVLSLVGALPSAPAPEGPAATPRLHRRRPRRGHSATRAPEGI